MTANAMKVAIDIVYFDRPKMASRQSVIHLLPHRGGMNLINIKNMSFEVTNLMLSLMRLLNESSIAKS